MVNVEEFVGLNDERLADLGTRIDQVSSSEEEEEDEKNLTLPCVVKEDRSLSPSSVRTYLILK